MKSVVPAALQNGRGHRTRRQTNHHFIPFANYHIYGQRHKGRLPNDANNHIEYIQAEVAIGLEIWIAMHGQLTNWAPPTPRSSARVKIHEHTFFFPFGDNAPYDRAARRYQP